MYNVEVHLFFGINYVGNDLRSMAHTQLIVYSMFLTNTNKVMCGAIKSKGILQMSYILTTACDITLSTQLNMMIMRSSEALPQVLSTSTHSISDCIFESSSHR